MTVCQQDMKIVLRRKRVRTLHMLLAKLQWTFIHQQTVSHVSLSLSFMTF